MQILWCPGSSEAPRAEEEARAGALQPSKARGTTFCQEGCLLGPVHTGTPRIGFHCECKSLVSYPHCKAAAQPELSTLPLSRAPFLSLGL